jgi:murein DD-endopeptidase MepM/ murein hydrolase activator NlpD
MADTARTLGARGAWPPEAPPAHRPARNRLVALAGDAAAWLRGRSTHGAALAARAALEGRAVPLAPPPSPRRPGAGPPHTSALLPALTRTLTPRHVAHGVALLLVAGAAALPATPIVAPRPEPGRPAAIVASGDALVPVAYIRHVAAPVSDSIGVRALAPVAAPAYAEYHTLAEGETLGELAARYGVTPEALFWSNRLDEAGFLAAGRELRVPRVSGLAHVVSPGETVEAIAASYGVAPDAILLFGPNQLRPGAAPAPGSELFVPGGRRPLPPEVADVAGLRAVTAGSVREGETNLRGGPGRAYDRVASLAAGAQLRPVARHADWVKVDAGAHGEGWVRQDLLWLPPGAFEALQETNDFPPPPPRWVWPSWGELTSPFGWRRVPFRSYHNGIDIANRAGTPILAARAGTVAEAGWCSGYGYCVKIDHGQGVRSIYGHLLKKPVVRRGDVVEAGQRIGLMGMSFDRAGGGYATGVHLHFTVTVNGKAVNPLTFLP